MNKKDSGNIFNIMQLQILKNLPKFLFQGNYGKNEAKKNVSQ